MKILVTGFKGQFNSSRVLASQLEGTDKLYLENDKEKSCTQLFEAVKNGGYDRVLLFGQKPIIKDKLSVELMAKRDSTIAGGKEVSLQTRFDLKDLLNGLTESGISFQLSNRAGNSYCNNIYYYALSEIEKQFPKIRCLLIHVPTLKNLSKLEDVVCFLNRYINNF